MVLRLSQGGIFIIFHHLHCYEEVKFPHYPLIASTCWWNQIIHSFSSSLLTENGYIETFDRYLSEFISRSTWLCEVYLIISPSNVTASVVSLISWYICWPLGCAPLPSSHPTKWLIGNLSPHDDRPCIISPTRKLPSIFWYLIVCICREKVFPCTSDMIITSGTNSLISRITAFMPVIGLSGIPEASAVSHLQSKVLADIELPYWEVMLRTPCFLLGIWSGRLALECIYPSYRKLSILSFDLLPM